MPPAFLNLPILLHTLAWQGNLPVDPYLLALFVAIVAVVFGALIGYGIHMLSSRREFSQRVQKAVRAQTEKVAASEREHMHKTFGEISRLTASLNYTRILNDALDLAANVLNGPSAQPDRLVSAVLLFAAGEPGQPATLAVGSSRRFTPADTRISLPGTSGLIGQSIEQGEASHSDQLAKDPELCRVVAMRVCQSAYSVPLAPGIRYLRRALVCPP